ncbi:type II toxin-antitoxin system PrlF family antitoxin [Vibrio vulnificus]|nr:type II toxin-antitoxin system PrlF family antitoxin [Vibrio vulnificus]
MNELLEDHYEKAFLSLLDKEIDENSPNLVIATPEHKQKLDEIVGDYKIDLNGELSN